MKTKQCSLCGENKPEKSFHRNKTWRDSRCPDCKSYLARQHREKNRDKLLEQTRKYQRENREYFREYNRSYRKRKREQAPT